MQGFMSFRQIRGQMHVITTCGAPVKVKDQNSVKE